MVQKMKEDTPYVSIQSHRFPETYSRIVNIKIWHDSNMMKRGRKYFGKFQENRVRKAY